MARSPVTNLLEGYNALSEVEQQVFLDLVDPQLEPEAPAKKTRKTRTARSPRAESLSNAIAKAPKAERSADPCIYQYPEDSPVNAGMVCGEFFENGIHDQAMGYAGYHEFQAPKVKKAAK